MRVRELLAKLLRHWATIECATIDETELKSVLDKLDGVGEEEWRWNPKGLPFICAQHHLVFEQREQLNFHLRDRHGIPFRWTCRRCGQSWDSQLAAPPDHEEKCRAYMIDPDLLYGHVHISGGSQNEPAAVACMAAQGRLRERLAEVKKERDAAQRAEMNAQKEAMRLQNEVVPKLERERNEWRDAACREQNDAKIAVGAARLEASQKAWRAAMAEVVKLVDQYSGLVSPETFDLCRRLREFAGCGVYAKVGERTYTGTRGPAPVIFGTVESDDTARSDLRRARLMESGLVIAEYDPRFTPAEEQVAGLQPQLIRISSLMNLFPKLATDFMLGWGPMGRFEISVKFTPEVPK